MSEDQAEIKKKKIKENLSKFKNTILVMSGKGGVGKSTVSVNLAYALAGLGKKVGILDIDFHGPSVAKMTGIEGKQIVMQDNGRPIPIQAEENICVLSLASLLDGKDDAVIWRGPMKMGVIDQFLGDFEWPELDYLVVDCPPGTGDEPLSIIQTIEDVSGVVIVSTPQDVAFADARKSISFCNKMNAPILGIVENMSGFICPECGTMSDIFKSGGAAKTAKDFNIEILGQLPLDPAIVNACDDGTPFVIKHKESPGAVILKSVAEKINNKLV